MNLLKFFLFKKKKKKKKDLTEFRDTLETEEIKPNNEAQEKYFEKRKVVINTAFKL